MAGDRHNDIVKAIVQLGRTLGFRPYTADNVGEATIPLPRSIDTGLLTDVEQIDVIWFNEFLFPKYAFEVELTTGVKPGIQRLYQLRHFVDCKLFIAIEAKGDTSESYRNRFDRITESDPFNQIVDRYYLITERQIEGLLAQSIKLESLKRDILDWDLDEAVLKLLADSGLPQPEAEKTRELPKWLELRAENWGRHFTPQKAYAERLFVPIVNGLLEAGIKFKVRAQRWYLGLYDRGRLIAAAYTRKDKLLFIVEGIEDHYEDVTLESIERPESDALITSARRYVVVTEPSDLDELIKLFHWRTGAGQ